MNNLTEDDTHTLRAQGDLKAYLRAQATAARGACEHRRRLVLAHPDTAARLTEPPLSCPTPEAWTGYIPPSHWHGAPNNSPIRAQLLAIVHAAQARAA